MLRLVVAVISLVVVVYAFKLGLGRNAPIQDLQGVPFGARCVLPVRARRQCRPAVGAGRLGGAPLADTTRGYRLLIRIGRWVAPVAVVVGMTLLNYHYLSDFAGGAAVGVLLLAFALLPVWSDRRPSGSTARLDRSPVQKRLRRRTARPQKSGSADGRVKRGSQTLRNTVTTRPRMSASSPAIGS